MAAVLAAVVALSVAPGAAAHEIPLRKAHGVAAARLLAYASTLTYVTDYELERCGRASDRRVLCAYRITRYTGETCSGTIAVASSAHGLSARLLTRCSFADAGEPPGPSPAPPPAPGPSPSPPPPPAPSGGYTDTGDHSLASAAADGSLVVLDDGSRWQVDPADQGEIALWEVDDDVTVDAGPGSEYTLTDTDAESSVVATFVGFAS